MLRTLEFTLLIMRSRQKVRTRRGKIAHCFFLSFCSIPSSVPSSPSPPIKELLFIKALGQPHLIFPFASLDLLYVIHSAQTVLYPLLRFFILGEVLTHINIFSVTDAERTSFKKNVYTFGCGGSLLLCAGFLHLLWAGAYSLVLVPRLLTAADFSCSKAQALGHLGFSSCGPWATGSIVVAQGLSCSTVCGIFLIGIKPMSLALAGRLFTDWTIREAREYWSG